MRGEEGEVDSSLESTTRKFFFPLGSMCPVPASNNPVMVSFERDESGAGASAVPSAEARQVGRERGRTSSPMVAISERSLYCAAVVIRFRLSTRTVFGERTRSDGRARARGSASSSDSRK